MVIRQKHLIEFQIYYVLVIEAAICILHVPAVFRYFLDINAIAIALLGLPKVYDMFRDKRFRFYNIFIILYMIAIAGVSLMRTTPVGRVAWAARNNFLYITFFLVAAYTLTSKDFTRIMNNVMKMQAFNFACTMYERFVMGVYGDNVGGMFGTLFGCNAYLNVYLFIINAYAIISFASKKIHVYALLAVILSSMIIAVSSELKFFYIEFAIIIVLIIVLSRTSFRNALIVMITVLLLFVGIQILSRISPESARVLQNFDDFISYAQADFGGRKISRMNAFTEVNEWWFRNRPKYLFFGYGFGYCEDSNTFSWARSNFAMVYASTGYRNSSAAMNLLETGYVGMFSFIGIFVWTFIMAQNLKRELKELKPYYVFTQIMSIMIIINIWYNSAIRLEVAYLAFFTLLGVFVFKRDLMKEEMRLKHEEFNRKRGITKSSIKFKG